MADLSSLVNNVKRNIKNNFDGKITGQVMQTQLIQIIDKLNDTKLDSKSTIEDLETNDKTIIGAINELYKNETSGINSEIVDELPDEGKSGTIYIVPSKNPTQDNNFDEYIWVDGKWEGIGGQAISGTIDTLTETDIKNITTL